MKKSVLIFVIILTIFLFFLWCNIIFCQDIFAPDKLIDSDGYPTTDKVQHFFKGGLTFTGIYMLTNNFWESMGWAFSLATIWEFVNAIGISENPNHWMNDMGFSYKDIVCDMLGATATWLTIKAMEYIFGIKYEITIPFE